MQKSARRCIFFKYTRFYIRSVQKKCELKRSQFDLQAFDKYVHSNGSYGYGSDRLVYHN